MRYTERSSAKVEALAEAFAAFHAPVDIQVYLTPDQQQAFGWHYDLEEVFIIQVQGCKEYTSAPKHSESVACLGHYAGGHGL